MLPSFTVRFLSGLSLLSLVACSGPAAEGSANPSAANLPQALFSQVQSSIASGQALDPAKPCHLDQSIQSPDQLQSKLVADFLQMKVPPFFSFTFSGNHNAIEAIYKQPLPAVTVRLRATLKDFQCESFTIDDPAIGTNTGSHLTAWAYIPSLNREAKDVHG